MNFDNTIYSGLSVLEVWGVRKTLCYVQCNLYTCVLNIRYTVLCFLKNVRYAVSCSEQCKMYCVVF